MSVPRNIYNDVALVFEQSIGMKRIRVYSYKQYQQLEISSAHKIRSLIEFLSLPRNSPWLLRRERQDTLQLLHM